MSVPFAHLSVLDLHRVLAGPWCTQLLAGHTGLVLRAERGLDEATFARLAEAGIVEARPR